MAFNRYSRSLIINRDGKKFFPSSKAGLRIRQAVTGGQLQVEQFVLAEAQRLDTVSADFYGDASYWWVIAAASGIGWQCQVPAGTLLRIPTSIAAVENLVA